MLPLSLLMPLLAFWLVASRLETPLLIAPYAVGAASPLVAIAGIITGHVAWRRSQPGGAARGRSIAALAIGYPMLGICALVIGYIVFVVWYFRTHPMNWI